MNRVGEFLLCEFRCKEMFFMSNLKLHQWREAGAIGRTIFYPPCPKCGGPLSRIGDAYVKLEKPEKGPR